jgi:uncharacterized protein with NRDE domain
MCLIAFDWRPGSDPSLVLAANRDEFHARPTRALQWWDWPAGPLAGIDEQGGGTWLAAGRAGRFAAVTNYRDPDANRGTRSRGELPAAWIESADTADRFAEAVFERRGDYGPFNLLLGDAESLMIVGTHAGPQTVAPGVHALSNHLLDTPWPKSLRAVRRLQRWIDDRDAGPEPLLDLLDDREPAPAHELPDTGVGEALESMLSAPFIVSDRYGTRSSSALVIGTTMRMAERSFDPQANVRGERSFTWRRA